MLAAQHEGISPTLRDDRLREEAKALEQKYMQKCDSQVGIFWFFKHVFEMKISHHNTCCLSELSFIIYNKPTRCNSGSIVFIKNYKYALRVSDTLCAHLQEHYKL